MADGRPASRLKRLRTVPVLPTMLTAGNLACGVTAIFCAASHHGLLLQGSILIFAAMICDMFDGKVARMTGTTGQFGAELDSLADVVSFGVAPAMLVHRVVLGDNPTKVWGEGETLIWSIAVLYAVFTAIRLARYNVEHVADAKATDHFTGLPSPGAAGFLCIWVLFYAWFAIPENYSMSLMDRAGLSSEEFEHIIRLLLSSSTVVMALLMVSKIQFPHVGNALFSESAGLRRVLLLILVICLMFAAKLYAVVALITGYVVISVIRGMPATIRRWVRGHDLLEDDEEESGTDTLAKAEEGANDG